ncbi:glycosyltransferase [Rhodopila sp.]|uniref:glycosyltransferase n=1 Tax=Rhodopila sp. TaxID=2480087 RepID=UPI002C5D5DD9|nr:glycosyltransferase [Rhodopila sp.]HVZ07362.1 glycosyltransferase [Rhodopila sp.]
MTLLAVMSLAIWVYLLLGHGRFWQSGPDLPHRHPATAPSVAVVVPARDEAPVIRESLHSLLAQDYAGPFHVILVDDGSSDGTGDIARALGDPRLTVLTGAARPARWSGKLWAVHQGIEAAGAADLLLLTDADIVHDPSHLASLLAQAESGGLDMVSEMVRLACDSWAERALVPAFVFFFQLLYPFTWVNKPSCRTAAAAGGTILVRRQALERVGGIAGVRGALIDDVALAKAIKRVGPIWLGHATQARSVRPYPGMGDIWRMITRTAYVQLRYSPLLLVATVLGMLVTWIVPPVVAMAGHGLGRLCGGLAWAMLALSYLPTLTRYQRSWLWAPFLPLVAAFYTAATVAAAINHHTGRGVAWKSRTYQANRA